MEIKLDKANENIIELVDRLVSAKIEPNTHNCLQFVLFGSRTNCNGECCACNREQKQRYREMLLNKYLVK
jgi:hypothetical protein